MLAMCTDYKRAEHDSRGARERDEQTQGPPPKNPNERRDARVQSFITELQSSKIEAFARMSHVDRVDVCREAVANFLASGLIPLDELRRLRKEVLVKVGNVNPAVRPPISGATSRVCFGLSLTLPPTYSVPIRHTRTFPCNQWLF